MGFSDDTWKLLLNVLGNLGALLFQILLAKTTQTVELDQAFNALAAVLRATESAQEAAVVATLVAVYEQRIVGNVFESPLIHWLAIKGIHETSLIYRTWERARYPCDVGHHLRQLHVRMSNIVTDSQAIHSELD